MKNVLKKLFVSAVSAIILLSATVAVYAEGENQQAQDPMGSLLGMLAYFAIIAGLFYLILYRPQRKKMKQDEAMRNSVTVGDNVVMTCGIIGKVVNIKDDEVTIETGAARTQLKFTKGAIGRVDRRAEEKDPVKSVDEKKAELQKKLDEKKAAKEE